jgi:hypothetical protein
MPCCSGHQRKSHVSPLINVGSIAQHMRMPEALCNWFEGTAFLRILLELDDCRSKHVDLYVRQLSHVALDPRYGHRIEDFIVEAGDNKASLMLNLYQRFNFLGGTVTLDKDTEAYGKLVGAMKANLEGPMFQAASSGQADARCADEVLRGNPNEVMLKFALHYMVPDELRGDADTALHALADITA